MKCDYQDFDKSYDLFQLLREMATEPNKESAVSSQAALHLTREALGDDRDFSEFLYHLSLVIGFIVDVNQKDVVTHCAKQNVDTESDLS